MPNVYLGPFQRILKATIVIDNSVFLLDICLDGYPFRAPFVNVNGQEWPCSFKLDSDLEKKWKKKEQECCFICSSILNQWSVASTLLELFVEIQKYIIYGMRQRNIRLCRYVLKQKIRVSYVPVEEFL